jgi:hypothetical protein
MGVIDMAAVHKEGNDGYGGSTDRTLEPDHHDVDDNPKEILRVTDTVLVDHHAVAGTASMAGNRPDGLDVPHHIQQGTLRDLERFPDFARCLLKCCVCCYTI